MSDNNTNGFSKDIYDWGVYIKHQPYQGIEALLRHDGIVELHVPISPRKVSSFDTAINIPIEMLSAVIDIMEYARDLKRSPLDKEPE